MGAAASAEEQYNQAGHAAADQAEAGADKLTQQVGPGSAFSCSAFLLGILVVTCVLQAVMWVCHITSYCIYTALHILAGSSAPVKSACRVLVHCFCEWIVAVFFVAYLVTEYARGLALLRGLFSRCRHKPCSVAVQDSALNLASH